MQQDNNNNEAITTIRTWEKTLGGLLPIAMTLLIGVCGFLWSQIEDLKKESSVIKTELVSIREKQITKEELKEFQINVLNGVQERMRTAILEVKIERLEEERNNKGKE